MGKADTETATRARTRHAILRAAITVFGQNPSAPLGEVADAAGVARSTLHRYFPERSDLIEALRRYADDEIQQAEQRALLDQGPALDALIRLCHEYFDSWNTLTWRYTDSLGNECEPADTDAWDDQQTAVVIARGHADGTIDPGVPALWLQHALWALIYAGWEFVRRGASRHEALTLTLDSVRRLAAPVGRSGPVIPPAVSGPVVPPG